MLTVDDDPASEMLGAAVVRAWVEDGPPRAVGPGEPAELHEWLGPCEWAIDRADSRR